MAAPITGTRGLQTPPGKSTSGTTTVLLLVFAVFFILGGVTNINDLLVGKFRPMFQLSHAEANLVQMAFFIAYAAFSIPAGIIMSRLGYIRTFVLGFVMVAAASLLFIPASANASFGGFLAALFFIGAGITVLQVAMNPVITTLGPTETSHSRLTFAQAFNSIGVTLMVYGGASVLLGDAKPIDAASATAEQLQAYRVEQGASIGHAYMWLAVAMLAIAALFWAFRSALDGAKAEEAKVAGTLDLLLTNRRVQWGALCIFMYVGAEVAIGSNMIAYLGEQSVMGLGLEEAGKLVAFYWGGAMIGRLVGGFVLRMFRPGRVLTTYAAAAIGLLTLSALSMGTLSGWSLILVGFCNSLMFPTIFSLGTEGLGERAPQGSGILCTAIVGGALVPFLFGTVADLSHNIRMALIVPAVCYAIIAAFGLWAVRHPSRVEQAAEAPTFQ
ncbi:FHS family L-fucose permease-like MFS transporter [Novosphingobium kunmingense]|uniref:FHS family L-fucose permease-like MFS transporter n=1 Tax=Novosphingobium kunmingense TaxID=1211806 RepID=A0A2N0H6P0_9SPHN|nr:sugar MFS transporter [Novosphingobium kunmingense]PKB14613.1 FHS family L-fucose permease-like MFS transporter [Novosphingobium kunmingense]